MSEIKTDNPEKLAEWQRTNNLEVNNLAQLCAILMKHEELLKQVLAFASDNIENLEDTIKAIEAKYEHLEKKLFIVTKNIGVPTDKDFKNRFIRTLADEIGEKLYTDLPL